MKIPDIISVENIAEKYFFLALNSDKPKLITYFNQHCFNVYYSSNEYREALKRFTLYSDGIGMYFALKMAGKKNSEKLNASDFNAKLFNICISNKTGIYFVGGNFTKENIIDISRSKKINCLGYQNGYFHNDDFSSIVGKIIKVNPPVIFIGMGVPRQELFALKLSEHLPGTVIICVGNFLEFYFGTIKRAPGILHNTGLEWLFRLFTEPKRLYKRYLFGIPLFIFRVINLYSKKIL